MRALVVRSPHDVALETFAEPTVGEDEVLVSPLLAGVCGTDLELIDGSIAPAYVRCPLVLGHEGSVKSLMTCPVWHHAPSAWSSKGSFRVATVVSAKSAQPISARPTTKSASLVPALAPYAVTSPTTNRAARSSSR
jgi:NADPH:quinone reductase-like Zn-dependent oxidoreductase